VEDVHRNGTWIAIFPLITKGLHKSGASVRNSTVDLWENFKKKINKQQETKQLNYFLENCRKSASLQALKLPLFNV